MRRLAGFALVAILALGLVATAIGQTTGSADGEVQRFTFQGNNVTGWRVHRNSTTPREMNLTLTGDILASGGYKVPYTFSHNNQIGVSIAQTNTVPIAGTAGHRVRETPVTYSTGVLYQAAPWEGSIIGVSIGSSAALTARSAHAEALVFLPATATVLPTGIRAAIGVMHPGNVTRHNTVARTRATSYYFAAGSAVGCRIVTEVGITPLTAELVCTIVVEF